jgi:hypothetical protein
LVCTISTRVKSLLGSPPAPSSVSFLLCACLALTMHLTMDSAHWSQRALHYREHPRPRDRRALSRSTLDCHLCSLHTIEAPRKVKVKGMTPETCFSGDDWKSLVELSFAVHETSRRSHRRLAKPLRRLGTAVVGELFCVVTPVDVGHYNIWKKSSRFFGNGNAKTSRYRALSWSCFRHW